MLVEEIENGWAAIAASRPFYPTLTFVGDAVMLGHEIKIAKAAEFPYSEDNETRALALIAAAFRRLLDHRSNRHFHRALQRRAQGDDVAASIHLALMDLPRVDRGLAARRLFVADHLLSGGIAPETILKALEIDWGSQETIRKYNPDQPRVPAGSGRISGQWTTDGEGNGITPAEPPRHSASSSPGQTGQLNDKENHSTSFGVRRWDPPRTGQIVSDANPDPINPGQQYAQNSDSPASGNSETYSVESAPNETLHVGDPKIDKITDTLLKTLQVVDAVIPRSAGPVYGTALHVGFANAVRALNLPGVMVEQSFDLNGFADYGADGSIRTDIVLMDETAKKPTALGIWDLKSGVAKLTSSRVKELRSIVPGGDKAWLLELRFGRALQRLACSDAWSRKSRETVVDRRKTSAQAAPVDNITYRVTESGEIAEGGH